MPIERVTELPPRRPGRRAPGTELKKRPITQTRPRAPTAPTRASQTAPKPKAIADVEDNPMSLHKGLLSALGRGLSQRVQASASGQKNIVAAAPAVLATVGRALPGIGVAAGSFLAGRFAGGGGGGTCEVGHHLNKQDGVGGPAGTYCVRNRRMNVGNARAARRAVRRLKGARKLLRDIEKMMPTRSTRRRAPAGHSAHLHHTGGS